MTLRFSKKEIIILMVTIFLTISMILSGYYFYLSPKKEEIETKSVELKSAQDLLTALQSKPTESSPVTVESVAALQRKVPVKPQSEKLIFDLEKAEVVSGSEIKNMAFSEADVSVPQQNTTQQQPAATDANQKSDTTKKNENTDSQPQTTEQINASTTKATAQTQKAAVPTGIKKLTVTLQVESPSYDELKIFINTLENSTRIIVIESVGFTGSGEKTNLDTEKKKLSFTVTLSAFYMPTLTDLQSQLPELVVPKSDPL
ncbi:pilus assembly protein PilO [Bacillus sp. 1NLA3E]|uniref:pilus assembly protein PilO n=1 Tax=Bacillus sp. 1NLA3E TaxID=666686 RepID=UPI000247EB15|nr:pilus assembly protein PilO [Bacillus sp. 1NLA3E]AGK55084.1 Pilus assembly protein PilO [Bacillus sp. 1NLA3E]